MEPHRSDHFAFWEAQEDCCASILSSDLAVAEMPQQELVSILLRNTNFDPYFIALNQEYEGNK
jgi:hypothetical protein